MTFAVALINQPDLLFLDEPTVGMDANSRKAFWDNIEQLRQEGKTIVITSHYLEEIQQIADRLLILQKGRLTFDGSLQQLQNSISVPPLHSKLTCNCPFSTACLQLIALIISSINSSFTAQMVTRPCAH